MNRTLLYILLSFSGGFFSGCDENQTPADNTEQQQLRFNAYLKEGDAVKPISATRAQSETLANGYKLIGMLTNQSLNISANTMPAGTNNKNLFWGTEMNKNGTCKDDTKHFWQADGTWYHSFFAYSSNGISAPPGRSTNQAIPTVTFVQKDAPTEQIDFLVAEEVANIQTRYNPPTVNLYFRHRLSRIIIKLMGSGGVTLYGSATIAYGTNALRKQGTVGLTPQGTIASASTYHSGTYTLNNDFTLSSSATVKDNALILGDLMLIPTSNAAAGFIKVDVTYSKSADKSGSKTISIELPEAVLKAEMQHTYILNIIETTTNLTIAGIELGAWINESTVVDELN